MQKEPFTIAVPEETLSDLHERLAKTCWAEDFANEQWQYGTNSAYLKGLSHERVPIVEAPTGMAVFVNEVVLMPRKWAERYYNLQRWTVMPSGGHFGAMEEPEQLVEDIRAFFRSLRG